MVGQDGAARCNGIASGVSGWAGHCHDGKRRTAALLLWHDCCKS
jgi:hypothetical protein